MNKNKTEIIKTILSITTTVLLFAAHVIVILISTYVFRYYDMYPELFIYLFIIIVCVFIIIDIVYFVGLRHKDVIQKSIVCFISLCMVIGGCYGASLISKANEVVDNVVLGENEEKKEIVSGVYVSYKNEKFESIGEVEQLSKISEFTLGLLAESSENSLSSIATEKLKEKGLNNFKVVSYANNTDLLFALINEEIDIAAFSSMYQAIFKADENVDYTQYLEQMHEIDTFEKEIIAQSNTSTKDLSKDPFNVLLIGWSPIIGSDTIGLADAIIVASVNPQTYTVSMMSIARDSYVPISCYGGERDKINSGRGTSMDCFVATVENLIGEEIDFYMEINFSGFADLCGHYGGIPINNPVSFELDGVYVPAGEYVADGWQALQFARERHHMPNGDFDRQQHQKEVIMQLANQFLSHPLSDALEAFNYVSNRLNTNMTLSQLTKMFNMLTTTKNYTGLSLFNLLDMHALRITGYADWHYNDDYELPLWIYRLYQGSIDESLGHMQEVLGNYKIINQDSGFSFNAQEPYVREPFYSTSYDEVETHEVLPAYYINLTSMTYEEVVAWAKENGVTLSVTFIKSGEEGYDESKDGMVISQSIAYGKRVSKYPNCSIVVMGNGKRKVTLPDYSEWGKDGYERAKAWCTDNEIKYEKHATFIAKDNVDKFVSGQLAQMKYDEDTEVMHIYYYVTCGDNAAPLADGTGCSCNDGYQDDGTGTGTCKLTVTVPTISNNPCGGTVESCKLTAGTGEINYIVKYEYSHEIANGSIISINPVVGTKIITGSTVTITISKGQNPNETQVPSLIGQTKDVALATCQSKELVASVEEVFSDTVGSGLVVDQSISANSYVDKGTTIKIYVSKGIDPDTMTTVPNFAGKTRSEAEGLCSSASLACTFNEINSEVTIGNIISEPSNVGQYVKKQTSVLLDVSIGPASPPPVEG